jgi:HEAT repeat protein
MDDEVRKSIAELLSHEEPDVRRGAAEDLAGKSGLTVIAALAAALTDDNKCVRDGASRTLLGMEGKAVARTLVEYIADANIVTRNLAGTMLRQLGEQSIPALLPYLQDGSHDVRESAVDLLGLIGGPEIAHHIEPLLDDPDDNVLVSAVEAAGSLRDPSVVPKLIDAYRAHPIARVPAAGALGKIGGPEACQFLLLAFNKLVSEAPGDTLLLSTVIDSLGAVGDDHARILLTGRVTDARGKLRHGILHAMVRIAERMHRPVDLPQALLPDLLDALKDDDPSVKASAAKVLAGVPGSDVTRALIECSAVTEELDALLFALLAARDDTLECIVRTLENRGPGTATQSVALLGQLARLLTSRIIRHEPVTVDEQLLARAFDATAAGWEHAGEETRAAIVEALFHLDGDRAVEFLDTLMDDPDPWLRKRVIELLARVESRRVPVFVRRFIDDEDERVRDVVMSILQSSPYAASEAQSFT